MAIVLPQVNPEAVEPPRVQPAADETTFGGGPGLAAEGAQAQEVAQHSNEIATFEKIRADQTAVQAATAQLAAIHSKLLTDPKEGLPAYQGINAMEGHDKIMAEYQKNANELAKNLQPDQQGAFNRIAIEQGDALNQHAMAYVNGQIEQHDTNTYKAAYNNLTDIASKNYGSPQSVDIFKGQLDNIVVARAKRLGLSPEETEDFKRQANTGFYETVLSQMVNDPNMKAQTKAYFKEHQDDMDAQSQDRVRTLIDTAYKQKEETQKSEQEKFFKNNLKQATLDYFDGKMSLGEAQKLFRDGKIDEAGYDHMQTLLTGEQAMVNRTQFQSDSATFNQIRTAQLTGSNSPEELNRMILRASSTTHKVGDADVPMLSHEDGKFLTQQIADKPPTARDKYIDAAASTVRDSANRYLAETHLFGLMNNKKEASEQAENLVQQFYNSVDSSKAQTTKQIDDLRDHIIMQGAAKRYPGLGKLDKMPDVVIDIKGNVTRLLNPDQHSGLKPKYKITPTAEAESDKKQE